MLAALRAQVVADARRLVEHRAAALDLAVERTQRVDVDALQAVAAELGLVAAQVLAQLLDVGGPALRVAHAVHVEGDALDADLGEDGRQQEDHLGVDRRVGRAYGLGADLVVLAVAPRLRLLVAEHRAVVPELHRLRQLVHAVLHVGAADGRRALGTQRQRAVALVPERVHLFAHDIGGLTDAALEQPRLLELGVTT